MLFAIISASLSRLRFIGLGIQPQGNAHLIECHVDPVGMNLDFADQGEEKGTQVLRIEILPAGGKPRGLAQKRLLGNGVGATALNGVQHRDRISEPCVYPASNQSVNERPGCADPSWSPCRHFRSAAIWRRECRT